MYGKIGLDFDCVICDLHKGINDYIRNKFNLYLDLEEGYPCLEIEKNHYFSREVSSHLLEVMHTEALLKVSEPCRNAKGSLLKLRSFFSEIIIITSRYDYEKEIVEAWLDEHGIVCDSIYYTSSSDKDKVEIIKETGVSVFVDDSQDAINSILHSGIELEYGTYLVTKPWNKFFHNLGVLRVLDLREVAQYIKLYSESKRYFKKGE